MARRTHELTKEQWEVVEGFIPKPPVRKDGKGRPRRDDRGVLEGIIWVLRTGAPWMDIPERFPSYSTCYRRFREWSKAGVLRHILEALVEHLYDVGEINLEECFVDATFVGAKKGVPRSVKRVLARGPRSWQCRTLMVFQSPYTQKVLRQLKSPLFMKLSDKVFLPTFQNELLVTRLTTVINSLPPSEKKE